MGPRYGETWVYEGIVGGIPGLELSNAQAVAIQFGLFQLGVLVLAAVYDLWAAVPAGTAAVVVAAVGSIAMHRLGTENRAIDAPESYYRMLFGSSIEVVLSVLAFIALVTYLFVFNPPGTDSSLFDSLFGAEPPLLVVYLALLVCWDLCYRIGTSWWVAVVSLWRALRVQSTPAAADRFVRLDVENVGFAMVQLLLVPFVLEQPLLLFAVTGHVVAVLVVSIAATALTRLSR